MKKFFEELKRRNVIRETLAYLAVAWVLLQVADIVLETFDAPDWISQTLVIILAVGLPVWVLLSWAYKITLKGFEKVSGHSQEEASQGFRRSAGSRAEVIIVGFQVLFLDAGAHGNLFLVVGWRDGS